MTERDTVQKKSTGLFRDPVADNSRTRPDEDLPAPAQKTTSTKTQDDLDDPFDNMPV